MLELKQRMQRRARNCVSCHSSSSSSQARQAHAFEWSYSQGCCRLLDAAGRNCSPAVQHSVSCRPRFSSAAAGRGFYLRQRTAEDTICISTPATSCTATAANATSSRGWCVPRLDALHGLRRDARGMRAVQVAQQLQGLPTARSAPAAPTQQRQRHTRCLTIRPKSTSTSRLTWPERRTT